MKEVQKNEFVNRLKKLSSCVVTDSMDELNLNGTMCSSIKPVKSGIKLVGQVTTTIRRIKREKVGNGDFSRYAKTLHEEIYNTGAGDIIIIDADGDTESASWGGNMSIAAKLNNLGGAIVDGAARDWQEIVEMGFPIFSKSFIPSAGKRLVTIERNVPVICGGIMVSPGDFILGDDDGVVVIPKNRIEEILSLAEKIEYTERKIMEYLKDGYKLPEAVKKAKTDIL